MALAKRQQKLRVSDGVRAKPLTRGGKPTPERGRQVLRLFTILRALENSRQGLTVLELKALLEDGCSLRTLYRDVEQLRQAGFPLLDEDGRFRIDPDIHKKLATTPIQPWEVLALLLGQQLLSPLGGATFAGSLRELQTRLQAHLTPQGRAWVAELSDGLRATVAAPALLHKHDAILDTLEAAITQEQCVHLLYAAPGAEVKQRTVEPHLLWYHAGRAYLAAYCRNAAAYRSFAIQRIESAAIAEESFDRRADFNAGEFVQRGFGVLHGPVHEVTVRFSPPVAHLARERLWHSTQRLEEDPSGAVRLSLRAAGLPEIAAWVASFGGKVTVLSPPELQSAVKALHTAGLAATGEAS
jgi:predicted DNA-binding transcriptional regulator YafY